MVEACPEVLGRANWLYPLERFLRVLQSQINLTPSHLALDNAHRSYPAIAGSRLIVLLATYSTSTRQLFRDTKGGHLLAEVQCASAASVPSGSSYDQ